MASVADFADTFVQRARTGRRTSVEVKRSHIETFLGYLAREGVKFAVECLNEIQDPELREIVKVLFLSATAGAIGGAAIGGQIGGPPGALVGAAVGAGVGLVIGTVAVTIKVAMRGDRILVSAN